MDTSPTGTPVIPPKAVPLVAGVLTALGGVAMYIPQNTIFAHILTGFLGIAGPLFGILSPGLRK